MKRTRVATPRLVTPTSHPGPRDTRKHHSSLPLSLTESLIRRDRAARSWGEVLQASRQQPIIVKRVLPIVTVPGGIICFVARLLRLSTYYSSDPLNAQRHSYQWGPLGLQEVGSHFVQQSHTIRLIIDWSSGQHLRGLNSAQSVYMFVCSRTLES